MIALHPIWGHALHTCIRYLVAALLVGGWHLGQGFILFHDLQHHTTIGGNKCNLQSIFQVLKGPTTVKGWQVRLKDDQVSGVVDDATTHLVILGPAGVESPPSISARDLLALVKSRGGGAPALASLWRQLAASALQIVSSRYTRVSKAAMPNRGLYVSFQGCSLTFAAACVPESWSHLTPDANRNL